MKPSGDSHDARGLCWIIIRFDMCRPAVRRTARGFGGGAAPLCTKYRTSQDSYVEVLLVSG